MAARSITAIAAIGLLASWPTHADPEGGDIVDQILRSTERPGTVLPPGADEIPPASTIARPDMAGRPPSGVRPPPIAAAPARAAQRSAGAPRRSAAAPRPGSPASLTRAAAPAARAPVPIETLDGPDIIGQPLAAPPVRVPPPEGKGWRGFYLGGNLGGGWTEGSTASTCLNSVTNTSIGCTILNDAGPNAGGILGGVQAGYLMPLNLGTGVPALMLGGEIDLQGSGISGQQNIPGPIPLVGFPPCPVCTFHASQSINWFGTLRARLGVPVDDMLLYATGGLMLGGVQAAQSVNFTISPASYSAAARTTLAGPTIGGGAELRLAGPWSVRLEALYYDLGQMRTVAGPMNGAFINFSNTKTFAFRGGMIRLGVNFRLGDIGL